MSDNSFPSLTSHLKNWRVAPPPKKVIDLSVLIESEIDCEFWSEGRRSIGALTDLGRSSGPYERDNGRMYGWPAALRCRPRMNHWHNWGGGECPLPEGFVVEVTLRGNMSNIKRGIANEFSGWVHADPEIQAGYSDIIAFRVVGVADGYCMPWGGE